MKDEEVLQGMVCWLSMADFYNPASSFGSVSDTYRNRYLLPYCLENITACYFASCIPESIYCCCVGKEGFRVANSECLEQDACIRSYSGELTRLGFCIIAQSMAGTPLLLDPESGIVCYFGFNYIDDDMLHKSVRNGNQAEVPATRENVIAWSQSTWGGLVPFFQDAIASTKSMLRNDLYEFISKQAIDKLHHYRSLNLPIQVCNAERRTPLEIARQTGNKEVIAIVEAIMKENE